MPEAIGEVAVDVPVFRVHLGDRGVEVLLLHPEHSGENFIAHVTVGLAKLDDLAEIEAESFDTFTFSPAGLSVYQLGNNGTAAKHLKSWTV